MYAKYITNSTSTAADVFNDLIAMFTGTTDVNTLSGSCNKAATEIHSSHDAAGWTMHDATAGTNAKVIKAPLYDRADLFKYARLDLNTAGHILLSFSELWNETTHVGTNSTSPQNNPANNALRYQTTAVNTYYLYSNNRCLLLNGGQNGTFGNAYGVGYFPYTMEFFRWSPWDTTAAGYPSYVSFNSPINGWYHVFLRRRSNIGADTVCTNETIPALGSILGATISKVSNTAGISNIPLIPLICHNAPVGHFGGNITEVTGIYGTASSLGTHGDEMVVNGVTYIYWAQSAIGALAIKKG